MKICTAFLSGQGEIIIIWDQSILIGRIKDFLVSGKRLMPSSASFAAAPNSGGASIINIITVILADIFNQRAKFSIALSPGYEIGIPVLFTSWLPVIQQIRKTKITNLGKTMSQLQCRSIPKRLINSAWSQESERSVDSTIKSNSLHT
jgi:hypothetical protein